MPSEHNPEEYSLHPASTRVVFKCDVCREDAMDWKSKKGIMGNQASEIPSYGCHKQSFNLDEFIGMIRIYSGWQIASRCFQFSWEAMGIMPALSSIQDNLGHNFTYPLLSRLKPQKEIKKTYKQANRQKL